MSMDEKQLKETFKLFDKDNDGTITKVELKEMMKKLGKEPSDEEVEAMIKEVDSDGDGQIDFEEFKNMMQADAENDEAENEQFLKEAFDFFDKDASGYIDKSELKATIEHMGQKVSAEELEKMMKEADTDGDGQISFEEFKAMMN